MTLVIEEEEVNTIVRHHYSVTIKHRTPLTKTETKPELVANRLDFLEI
jgi:hypothetical protein